MISFPELEQQLKSIGFKYWGWGRTEVRELCYILMPDEEIEECVNGYYEAGFGLLVATKDRLLIVDKKPLNSLRVEDLRFDMINQFDYGHRFFGAQINISAGMKTLHFTSLNQRRLRRLLNYVQCRMTAVKHEQKEQQDSLKNYMEQMNQQLQMYLILQQYQQQQLSAMRTGQPLPQINNRVAAAISHFSNFAQNYSDLSPAQIGVSAMKKVMPLVRSPGPITSAG